MKRKWQSIICGVALGVLSLAPLASAHHSFAAEFDFNKQITLKGSITKVEWTNPHTYFYIDGKDETGKAGNWAVEGGAPNVLYRQGWKPDTLKIGDQVTVGGPDTCAFIPRGVAHAWKNTGAEPGRALFLYTPGGAGRMFEEARRLQRPLSSMDEREIAEFFKRFGWETVGPSPF